MILIDVIGLYPVIKNIKNPLKFIKENVWEKSQMKNLF